MTRRVKTSKGFRYIGLLAIVTLGFLSIVATDGGDSSSDDKYLRHATVINEPPPPETASASTPAIFDLSVHSSGGASITFRVSFNDIEGDVTTFCIVFDDQPKKYYAYNVKADTYGQTSYVLSVADLININTIGTYCITVFIQDEAGNTSNKLTACFYIDCEPYDDDCYSSCDEGTMTMTGTIDGDSINVSGYACASKNDDIEVGMFCSDSYYGLIIKEPDKLAAGTTYTVKPHEGDQVMPDDFPIVVECLKPDPWKETASGGTFTVITYSENGLNATYNLMMPDGGRISGEITLWDF